MFTILLTVIIGFIIYAAAYGKKATIKEPYYFDLVFIQRMSSIYKHVQFAIEMRSLSILQDADNRVIWENNFERDEHELEQMGELTETIERAKSIIEYRLIEQN